MALQDAAERAGTVVSEGYYRVRAANAGRLDTTVTDVYDFDGVTTEDTYTLSWDAPYGIAGDTDVETSYASGLTPAATADEVGPDRLGEQFTYTHESLNGETLAVDPFLKLELTDVLGSAPAAIPLNFDPSPAGAPGIRAAVVYGDSKVTLHIDKYAFDSEYGSAYDDAMARVSYDTCVFDLVEMPVLTSLDATKKGLQYHVSGGEVTFNKPLEADLAIRPMVVTQYRLGRDVVIKREDGTNTFVFQGRDKQPGEAGGPIGKLQSILGFEYSFEADFPGLSTGQQVQLSGGSSGAGASEADIVDALPRALSEYREQNYMALVVADTLQ